MINFLPLEKEVLDKLLDGDHPVLALLRDQLAQAKIKERTYSGSGFFLELIVDEELAIPKKPNFHIGDVAADIAGLQYGSGFIIFVNSGLLDTFEGASYEEDWPKEIPQFKVKYMTDGARDMAKLEKALSSI